MLKKLDKLIMRAFIGPFLLTFAVLVFIFLTQYMLKYFEDFVGKDLGAVVFGELLFYFSLNMMPVALPLAVLLSSLMTYGSLGEHFELTAIKSAGISLTRIQIPVFIFVVFISIGAFFFSNYVVPKTNLRAYSLLYDIRQKKPSLDIRQGAFYYGLPGYSVKINQKLPDGHTLKTIMIYDHTQGRGNVNVTLADSGQMYTMFNDRYLVLELFNGRYFSEGSSSAGAPAGGGSKEFVNTAFARSKMVFSLASFDMSRTNVELFSSNKMMRTVEQLNLDIDSVNRELSGIRREVYSSTGVFISGRLPVSGMMGSGMVLPIDTATNAKQKSIKPATRISMIKFADSIINSKPDQVLATAFNNARNVRGLSRSYLERFDYLEREARIFQVEAYRKYSQSVACLTLFLIGASLGAIIKKGGLGMPVIISIVFFIIYYVLSITGEKWVKEGVSPVFQGMWTANIALALVGLFFLRQARHDSRLLETDYYINLWLGLRARLSARKK